MTCTFLDFADEILHSIIVETHPADLAALSGTCRYLRDYIHPNPWLWQQVYRRHYDPLNLEIDSGTGDDAIDNEWHSQTIKNVRLQKVLDSKSRTVKEEELVSSGETITKLLQTSVQTSLSKNIEFLDTHFITQSNFDVFLFSSSLYEHCGSVDNSPANTEEARQQSAKLHCLYGTAQESVGRTRSQAPHPWARSRVYDIRRYNSHNKWGPFKDDSSMNVDWEKVEAIMIVLGHSIDQFRHRCAAGLCGFNNIWDEAWGGVAPNSFVSPPPVLKMSKYVPITTTVLGSENSQHHHAHHAVHSSPWPPESNLIPQPDIPLEARDPYGVTGTWNRVVSFLDYHDFYYFNFGAENPPWGERPPITTQEAVRFIMIKIAVTKIQEPGPDDNDRLPVVKFTGVSRSMHSAWDPNANSKIVGSVRLTKEGEVRWTTLSIFHGEARWKSEGVQVGGLRSKRGVIGTWFDKDWDIHGPAGPTAFWKVSDDLQDEPRPQPLPEQFQ